MKNKLVSLSMLLMLLISTVPFILNAKPVKASITGPSLIVDDAVNQVHARLGAAGGSAVTIKGPVTNLAVPDPEDPDDSISGSAGLKAYYFDGSKGLLNPSDGNVWEMTVTNIDASLITGNKAFMFIVQDHGTGSGWESLIIQVHMNFYGAGGHLLQSFDNGWVLKSSHGFDLGDVPGKFDLRMLVQDLGSNYQVTPQFRLPSGVWQTFYDGTWTSANYELTKTRLAMQIDAGGGGTVTFDKPLAHSNGVWYADPNTTIQAAINAASSDETIKAFAGIYPETISITKSLTVTGDPGDTSPGPGVNVPILDGATLGNHKTAVTLSQGVSNAIFEGFEIRNYGTDASTDNDGVSVWNNGTFNVQIRDNYIHDVGYDGVLTGNGWGGPQGLHSGWIVTRNTIKKFGAYAVDLENAKDSQITNNVISDPTYTTTMGVVVAALSTSSKSITMSNITVSGNQFNNYPDRVIQIMAWVDYGATGSATLQNVTISGNTITGSFVAITAWTYAGSGTGIPTLRDLSITGNIITVNNPKDSNYVFDLTDVGGTNSFCNNQITLTGVIGVGGTYFDGADIHGSSTGAWEIDRNQLNGNNVGAYSSGFYMWGDLPATAVLNMTCNNVTKFAEGIWSESLAMGVQFDVHYNNIAGNSVDGILNGAGAMIDARFNWWGDASGPRHSSNPGGTGDAISDNVDYSPWLGFVVGTSPMTWHVNPTGTIQEAIDEASSGDTVIVHDGTYRGALVINKSITLKSASKPVIEAPDTRKTYTIPESSATFDPIIFAYGGTESGGAVSGSGTISVSIDGFEIDGRNTAGSARFVGILCRNVNPGTISNIDVHSMYPSDGQGHGPQTFGILFYGDSNATIENNELEDFSRGGIGVTGDNGPLPDPIATIKQNIVTGNGLEPYAGWWAENGIQISYGAGGSIIENKVTDCKVNNPYYVSTGILVIYAAQGVIVLRNNVTNCDTGIAVSAMSSPSLDVVNGNNVTECTYDAIRLGLDGPVDHVTVSNNIVSRSMFGIGVWDASDNTINNNIIKENDYGIDIDGNSNNNSVTYNDILDNTVDGIVIEPYGGFDPSGTQIHYNNITGNSAYGVEVTGTNVADARLNWWGSQSGPYHSTLNPTGLGDKVTDKVDFIPWLQVIHGITVIDVSVSPTTVVAGQTVTINVTVKNEGSDYENFTVTAYYDSTAIASQNVTNLLPNWNTTLTFLWNTTGMARGNYTIKAVASTVLGETNTANNVFINGKVQVLWHDVAVMNITSDRNWVFQGHSANINVTVKNNGDFPENVTVTLYYNITANQIVGTQNITLLIGESNTLQFVWNTAGVPYCHNYTLTAVAAILADNNPADNTLSDGNIKVRILGDINGDGSVNMADISIVINAFLTLPGHPLWNPQADLDGNGSVDMLDICITILNFMRACP
jgi:parallel beta-helix repeat protein